MTNALPDCYPAGITDALGGDCVRYPIAWLGGRPQYPDPQLDWKQFSIRGLNLLDLSWEQAGGILESARNLDGPWTPVTATAGATRVTIGAELQKFYRLRPESPTR